MTFFHLLFPMLLTSQRSGVREGCKVKWQRLYSLAGYFCTVLFHGTGDAPFGWFITASRPLLPIKQNGPFFLLADMQVLSKNVQAWLLFWVSRWSMGKCIPPGPDMLRVRPSHCIPYSCSANGACSRQPPVRDEYHSLPPQIPGNICQAGGVWSRPAWAELWYFCN